MEKERLDNQLIKYFAGECSPLEKEEIHNWINSGDENRDYFNNQKEIWEKITAENIEWNTEASWREFAAGHGIYRLKENDKPTGAPTPIIDIGYKKKPAYLRFGYMARAAAVLFIFVIAGYLGLKQAGVFNSSAKTEITWSQTKTVPSEKIVITLSDNSIVILNAESRLNYPSGFSGRKREVYLEGEAYFEVQHDTARPFIIYTQNVSTTVLGTKFNVSAFPGENNIAVSLVEGKVNVAMNLNSPSEKVIELMPKQQLTYDKSKKTGIVNEFDYQKTIGWKDKNFIFDGETLVNVFIKLERAYGVKFELADKSLGGRKIKVNFQNASLWTINESLKKLTGLKYKTIEENNVIKKVIFYSKQINSDKKGE